MTEFDGFASVVAALAKARPWSPVVNAMNSGGVMLLGPRYKAMTGLDPLEAPRCRCDAGRGYVWSLAAQAHESGEVYVISWWHKYYLKLDTDDTGPLVEVNWGAFTG